MGSLTGLLYACLGVFLGGWYLGKWTGNFSLLLFILTVVTLAYWLAERFVFAPRRRAAAATLERETAARRDQLAKQGIAKVDDNVVEARERLEDMALITHNGPRNLTKFEKVFEI